ncbi:MAG: SUMF1/EgtB/PvdO family nonheme iron enzyme [Verrucomicrobiaceae bacterium]|nr:SUMF1/EgtB/PvdO family nonheme iron enzyme [Verrucomicrobiaceae bacterium]
MKPEAALDATVRRLKAGLEQRAASTNAWENSLGMRFVPLRGSSVMFSVWETRVKDYQRFVQETGRPWDKQNSPEKSGWLPATMVNLYDTGAFCEWLTRKERQEGIIGPHDYYRLPSHDEWQAAAGGNYPWGDSWPPPPGAGNLSGGEIRERYEKLRDAGLVTAQTMIEDGSGIEGYEDGFATLAPVGSFEPNALGMHDLAGNVQEWCAGSMADLAMPLFTSEEKSAVGFARGGSFFTADANTAATSHRKPLPAFEALYEDTGFRCVLAREFTLLSLHETADSPIEDSIEINGPWTDKPVHGRRHPVVMASNLVSLAVSTRWRPKMEIGFESEDERLRDPAGWRKERRLLMMIGGAVCLFHVAEDGFLVENATRTIKITFASLDDLNRVKALLEPRLKPRY